MRAFGVLLVTVVASACDSRVDTEDGDLFTLEGREPVVSSAAPSDANWTVDETPTLVLGGASGAPEHLFHGIAGAFVLDDGRIVVGDRGTNEVRFFQANGEIERTVGGGDRGPGELGGHSGLSSIWRIDGDTVAAWVNEFRELSYFGPDGTFLRRTRFESDDPWPLTGLGVFADGSLAAYHFINRPPEPGVRHWRERERYVRYGADGSSRADIGRLPGWDLARDASEAGYGRVALARHAARGVHGDRFYYSSGDRFEVWVFREDGEFVLGMRRPDPDRALTPEVLATYKEEAAGRAPEEPAARKSWMASLDEVTFPVRLPATWWLEMDRDGLVWVSEFPIPGRRDLTWSVFSQDGSWIANVVLPSTVRARDIGSDYVLASVTDVLGIEQLRLYKLSRSEER